MNGYHRTATHQHRALLAEIEARENRRMADADSADDYEFLTARARATRERMFPAQTTRPFLVPTGMDEVLDGVRARLVDQQTGARRTC